MEFLRVELEAAEGKRESLHEFYGRELGLSRAQQDDGGSGYRAGNTVIEFKPVAEGEPFYHFAFRVPRNRFSAAAEWLSQATELLPDKESGETTFDFDNWNASACYAHDPCGNIVELIAHRELPEEGRADSPFSAGELLGVCEVGLVGSDLRAMAQALEPLGIGLWDGALDEPGGLAFMGGRDGVLILAPTGRGWLPTGRAAELHRVEALVLGVRDAEATLPRTAHRVRTTAERP